MSASWSSAGGAHRRRERQQGLLADQDQRFRSCRRSWPKNRTCARLWTKPTSTWPRIPAAPMSISSSSTSCSRRARAPARADPEQTRRRITARLCSKAWSRSIGRCGRHRIWPTPPGRVKFPDSALAAVTPRWRRTRRDTGIGRPLEVAERCTAPSPWAILDAWSSARIERCAAAAAAVGAETVHVRVDELDVHREPWQRCRHHPHLAGQWD